MKKNIILFLICFVLSNELLAQKGGNSIVLVNQSITVAKSSNESTIDPYLRHSIEMWVKPASVTADQKIFSKIGSDFENGYILGIANGNVVYEVFDDFGNSVPVTAGPIKAGEWTHITATYRQSGKQKIYINGELAASKDALTTISRFSTTDLVIGAASWFPTTKMFTGEVDEIGFYSAELADSTIKNWMYKSSDNSDHPDRFKMGLYFNCDEASGSAVMDGSGKGNNGVSSGSRTTSTVPFKGSKLYAYSYPEFAAVWKGQPEDVVDNLTVRGLDLVANQPTVVEATTIGSTTFCAYDNQSGSVDSTTCRFWHAVHYGNPKLEFEFDLSAYDLTGISLDNIVLCQSPHFADFSAATIIQGSVSESTFTTNPFIAQSEQLFYLVGFVNSTANVNYLPLKAQEIKLYPNPSNGQFTIDLDMRQSNIMTLSILDVSGKEVLNETFQNGTALLSKSFDMSGYPKGMYMVRVASESGLYTKRFIIQ